FSSFHYCTFCLICQCVSPEDLNQPPPLPVPRTEPSVNQPSSAVHPTVPSQHQVSPPQAKPPSPLVALKQNAKLRERLLVSGAITLLALVGTQIYSYVRYGLFPTNPIFTITGLPSSFFLERTLTGHSSWVISVAISPDGNTLASGSNDKTIKLWNLATGEQTRTLQGHSDLVHSVAISPDGKTLTSGSVDKTIKLWNLATGEQIRTLQGHSDSVISVAISPDGKTLASGSFDKTIKIWRIP
ncbi:MAG: serine/threonine protein kinase, partial [Rhizonema sp. PD38]|nr:serine/threonine protein kinase [Rhizonema sp. PD38]